MDCYFEFMFWGTSVVYQLYALLDLPVNVYVETAAPTPLLLCLNNPTCILAETEDMSLIYDKPVEW